MLRRDVLPADREPRSRANRLVAFFAGVSILLSACQSEADKKGFDELNQDRVAYKVTPLKLNSQLQTKANEWVEHLADTGVLAHSDLTDGAPANWCALGENVGYGSSIAQVQDAYMRSAAHRANVLNRSFDVGAVAIEEVGSRVYSVQLFMDTC